LNSDLANQRFKIHPPLGWVWGVGVDIGYGYRAWGIEARVWVPKKFEYLR